LISRDEAWELVEKNISQKNLRKHILAVEAIMIRLARDFEGDEQKWGMAGLLHDLDYEKTAGDHEKHGYVALEMLDDVDVGEDIKHAILAHVGHVERKSMMDKAIYCADPVTGLIVASALMHPTKSLAGMDAEFVGRRFKEKRFAAGADRDAIATCKELGLDLQEFLEISLEAMESISQKLGL
jgi:putative nucleotidyltransferase with HDIG domain